jgi:hypothetical protein
VVPVFNYGRYLESCLRSVLEQDGAELEVIVIDDASSDDSLAVANRLAGEDPRIRVIAQPRNRGHIPTVNEGMAQVRGEFVVKLDADDLLTPGSLRRSLALLDAHPEVGLVYGFPVTFHEDPPPPARTAVRSWTVWPGRDWLRLRCLRGTNCIRQPEAVIRAAVLREAGPYDPELPHTSDFAMWMRLAALADVGRVNGAEQGYYREHAQSMSRTVNGGLLTDVAQRLRAFDRTLTDPALTGTPRLPSATAAELRDLAHRAVAREAVGHAISAYARGVAEQEPPDGFLEVARQAYPDAHLLREWRALDRVRRLAATHPSMRVREVARDLGYRYRWRRWRWSGV